MTERRYDHSLLAWASRAVLAVVLLGAYAPIVMIVIYSFNQSRIGTVWTGFSWDGYRQLFAQTDLWKALATSCLIGAVVSTLSVVAGTMGALGLRHWRSRPRMLAQGLLALPLVTPDVIMALSLAMFFYALGIRQGWGTIVAAHCVFGISYASVVMRAAVQDLDESLYAVALDCGATPWQAVRRVTLPILAPSLAVAWLFVFALSLDDFLITFMTKGPGTDTLPIKIYAQMRFGIKPQTSALFVVLFVATLLGALAATRLRGTSKLIDEH